MMKRMAAAIAVLLLMLLVAVLLLVTVGWKLALVVAVLGVVASVLLGVRAVTKFSKDPFGDDFFTGK